MKTLTGILAINIAVLCSTYLLGLSFKEGDNLLITWALLNAFFLLIWGVGRISGF